MAHNIYNGEMAFAGELPWHGIGRTLPSKASIDDVLKAVSLYDVREAPLFAAGINGPIPDRKALVASTDGRYLSTVGADYGVVQFREMYAPLIQELHGEVVWHTVALLGERGERAFLLAEFPEGLKVDGDKSAYRNFVLLFNGHDGMTSAKALDTNVRVVCQNTVNMALAAGGSKLNVSVRHTSNAAATFGAKFSGLLKTLKSRRENFGRVANFLNGVSCTQPERAQLLDRVIPLPEKTAEVDKSSDARDSHLRKVKNAEEARGNLRTLLEGKTGKTTEIFGTVWGAFQAVVEYADHVRPNRMGKDADGAAKLESSVDGGVANFKAEAYAATIANWGLQSRVAELVRA